MPSLDERITFRVSQVEKDHLKKEAEKPDISGQKYNDLSDYIRGTLLEKTGFHSTMIKHQLRELNYEVHKIGVNINQITKKINGGYGTEEDVQQIKAEQKKLIKIFEDYKEMVEPLWQLRS